MTVDTEQTSDDEQAGPGGDAPTQQKTSAPSDSRVRRAYTAMTTPITLPWWTVWVGAAVAFFVVGLVVVLGVRSTWGADQWGDVATWLAGFATTAAVVVAIRQTNIAWRAAKAAIDDAAAVKSDADDRLEREIAAYRDRVEAQLRKSDELLEREISANREQFEAQLKKSDELHEREINAYRERVEAQLKKSDELYERQARAANLAEQRAELLLLWPVLEETESAARRMAPDRGESIPDRDEWDLQLAALSSGYSRARLFLHDEQVQLAITQFTLAVDLFDQQLRDIEKRPEAFDGPAAISQILWTRFRHIIVTRIALHAKASARLVEFAPDEVVKRADGWSNPT